MKEVMGYRGLAAYLGMSEVTLRHWVMRGKIPYTKAGSRVIFRRRDIENWMENNTKKTKGGNRTPYLPFEDKGQEG
jgi:excisionase family DNA binding protein